MSAFGAYPTSARIPGRCRYLVVEEFRQLIERDPEIYMLFAFRTSERHSGTP